MRRLLADLDEQRLVQARAGAASILVMRAERRPTAMPTASAISVNTFSLVDSEDAEVVAVVVVRVADRQRHRLETGPRRVGVEGVAGVRVAAPARRSS